MSAPRSVWIFDLDNTIYPATSSVGLNVSNRMTEFIIRHFEINEDDAFRMRRDLFHSHGTTMNGLMELHGVDPHEYMRFVHDVDLSDLIPSPELQAAIEALPGQKFIHTNASAGHAERILAHLGLRPSFSGIFDIVAADFAPKPGRAGYDSLLKRFGVDPTEAVMVEDMARNLKPAHELGMMTVWVDTHNDWAREGAVEPWVHHRTDDLAGWLDRWHRANVDSARPAADRDAPQPA